MPKRSNAFQKLIALVNKQLAEHAHVVESPLLTDTVTGEPREVDVLIETPIAGYEIRLAVECIDRKRKADVTWVEKMFQKHQCLPTDKLILVSRSGFSSAAIHKAQFFNIKVLTLEDAIEQNWLQKIQSIAISSVQLRITGYALQLLDTLEDGIVKGPPVLFDPEGHPGDLLSLIRTEIMSKVDLNKFLIDLLIDKKDSKEMVLAVDLTTGIYRQWYLIDSLGKKHHIKWFRMHVRVERSEKTNEVQHRRYADANIAFAFLDEDQTDIVVFVQSRDGTITAAADSLARTHKPEETIFPEYYFLNDQLLPSAIKNLE
ncbi:MAG: hypothetical protein IH977_16735 [Nitrospinae bacterium]|nr:hypothetical protein [Nitrospinota bacterium]